MEGKGEREKKGESYISSLKQDPMPGSKAWHTFSLVMSPLQKAPVSSKGIISLIGS